MRIIAFYANDSPLLDDDGTKTIKKSSQGRINNLAILQSERGCMPLEPRLDRELWQDRGSSLAWIRELVGLRGHRGVLHGESDDENRNGRRDGHACRLPVEDNVRTQVAFLITLDWHAAMARINAAIYRARMFIVTHPSFLLPLVFRYILSPCLSMLK